MMNFRFDEAITRMDSTENRRKLAGFVACDLPGFCLNSAWVLPEFCLNSCSSNQLID